MLLGQLQRDLSGKSISTGDAPAVHLPVTRELGETSLMLLVHPTLTSVHVGFTCDTVTRIANLAAA